MLFQYSEWDIKVLNEIQRKELNTCEIKKNKKKSQLGRNGK